MQGVSHTASLTSQINQGARLSLTKLAALSVAAVLALGTFASLADDPPKIVVDPAIATMTADQKVEARQQAMKEDGGVLKTPRP